MRLILAAILLLIAKPNVVFADRNSLCPGEEGYYYTNSRRRNPTRGGFVAHTAYVDDNDDLFLAPTAAVCGNAQLYGHARVLGRVVITGNAEVYGRANIKGNVRIEGDSTVSGNARLQDNVKVKDSDISGNAKLKGYYKAYNTTISSGTYDAPEFTQEELDAQRRAREDEARRQADAQRRQNEANARARRQAEENKRSAAANKKIADRRKAALGHLSAAKESLEGAALKLEKSGKNIWVQNSGPAKMNISSSDPCQFTITGSGGVNAVKVNLRYRQNFSPPYWSTYTDISNLSSSDRRSFLFNKEMEYLSPDSQFEREAAAYYKSNPSKVSGVMFIFSSKEVDRDSYNDHHFNNSVLNYRRNQKGSVQYFKNDDYRLGLIFSDFDSFNEFRSNLISAYNNYCPTDETK